MEYIGFDVHKQYTVACVINRDTGEEQHYRLKNYEADFRRIFGNTKPQKTVLEASGYSYVVCD